MTAEQWGPWIPGWRGYYQINARGEILSVNRMVSRSNGTTRRVRQRIMSPKIDKSTGLRMVALCRDHKYTFVYPHKLVRELFDQEAAA